MTTPNTTQSFNSAGRRIRVMTPQKDGPAIVTFRTEAEHAAIKAARRAPSVAATMNARTPAAPSAQA